MASELPLDVASWVRPIEVVEERTWLDFDRDGADDLFISDPIDGDRLLRNRGDGSFEDVSTAMGIRPAQPARRTTWVDHDGDGWLDLFRLSITGTSELLRNDRGVRLLPTIDALHRDRVGVIKEARWQDLDGDGRCDLILLGATGDLSLLRTDLAGATRRAMLPATTPGASAAIRSIPQFLPADFDLDGRVDLLACQDGGVPRLLRAIDDASYADVTVVAGIVADAADTAEWLWFDQDDRPDLLLSSGTRAHSLYRNRSDGTFDRLAVTMTAIAPSPSAAGSSAPAPVPGTIPASAPPTTPASGTTSAVPGGSGAGPAAPAPPSSSLDIFYVNDNSPGSATAGQPEIEGGDDSTKANDIKDNTIVSSDIRLDTIMSSDIRDGTIASADIQDGAIASADIQDGAISSADIQDGAVSSADILDGAILGADIADQSVDPAKITGTVATLNGDQDFDSGTLFIDAGNNRVGVGTTSPAFKLQVSKGGSPTSGEHIVIACGGAGSSGVQLGYVANGVAVTSGLIRNASNLPITIATTATPAVLTLQNDGDVDVVVGDLFVSAGNIGIGVTSPTLPLEIAQSRGAALAAGWTTYSSRRWKKDIEPITDALTRIERLRGVAYTWMASGKRDIGFIAEEVAQVVPEIVEMEENGVDAKCIDYARMTSLLVEAVKAQQRQIDELRARLAQIEATPSGE